MPISPVCADILPASTQRHPRRRSQRNGNHELRRPLTPGISSLSSGTRPAQRRCRIPLWLLRHRRFISNNVTCEAGTSTPRAMLAVTYHYRSTSSLKRSQPTLAPPAALTFPVTNVNIDTNGGIFNARLASDQSLGHQWHGFEAYLRRQRLHAITRASDCSTTASTRCTSRSRGQRSRRSFNDLEHHNNTNNITPGIAPQQGPMHHVDHSRIVSVCRPILSPSEHYGFDLNYGYSDVYTSTNMCFLNGATPTLPGTAVHNGGSTRSLPGCLR